MAKNKLKRFRENEGFSHLFQPSREEAQQAHPLKGKWHSVFFKNDNPIVLELACGNGDYAVGLAEKYPDKNFIGVDIKGARLWTGAKKSNEAGMKNVAFLRTQIELIENFFAENEVDEIWITFPDPQIKYKRAKHRLTHPLFLDRYRKFLKPEGVVHLKCDSEFLHGYTHGIIECLGCTVHEAYHDIYKQLLDHDPKNVLFTIKTYYEQKWLEEGKAITYIRFSLDDEPAK
ncbi:MAG: tRNA (guanosine(46)-N7)-methyltransferase TrmB [Schleiferiaceae bacterium]|jgi:tRNA (guanine-N7-)-methyltransferase|nr:tRNA (guanosine(46)-N7)-methyltransferase TrmB [Schleiferiaceae bacterium]